MEEVKLENCCIFVGRGGGLSGEMLSRNVGVTEYTKENKDKIPYNSITLIWGYLLADQEPQEFDIGVVVGNQADDLYRFKELNFLEREAYGMAATPINSLGDRKDDYFDEYGNILVWSTSEVKEIADKKEWSELETEKFLLAAPASQLKVGWKNKYIGRLYYSFGKTMILYKRLFDEPVIPALPKFYEGSLNCLTSDNVPEHLQEVAAQVYMDTGLHTMSIDLIYNKTKAIVINVSAAPAMVGTGASYDPSIMKMYENTITEVFKAITAPSTGLSGISLCLSQVVGTYRSKLINLLNGMTESEAEHIYKTLVRSGI